MKAHRHGVGCGYTGLGQWAVPLVLASVLLVFGADAAFAATDDMGLYAFPFLSNSAEQAKMLANAFGTQMLLFTSAIGSGMPGFTYLAAFATMLGGLYLLFKREFKPAVVFSWLLVVGLVLFVPLNSKMMFYPIDLQAQQTQFVLPTQLGVVDDGFIENLSSFSRFDHKGEACSTSPQGCGFTPQLVAVHMASTLQLIFSDLFRSTQWEGLLERADADNKLRQRVELNLGDTWLRETEYFKDRCGEEPVLGDFVNKKISPQAVQDINKTTSPLSFEEYWKLLRHVYMPSDQSMPPPVAVMPETLAQAQELGWGEPPQGNAAFGPNVYTRYYAALKKLYEFYDTGANIQVAFDTAPANNGKTVQQVIEYLGKKGFFASTISEYYKITPWENMGAGYLASDGTTSAPANTDVMQGEDVKGALGFFLAPYSVVTAQGSPQSYRRACFRNSFDTIAWAAQNFWYMRLVGDYTQEQAYTDCVENHGYPSRFTKTFDVVDYTAHQGFEGLEKVSESNMQNNVSWRVFYNPELREALMDMPVAVGYMNTQTIDPTKEQGVFKDYAPPFTVASAAYSGNSCKLDGQRLLNRAIYVLDDVKNDRGGRQPDGLFQPLITWFTQGMTGSVNVHSNPNGGIPDKLTLSDIIDVSAVSQEGTTLTSEDDLKKKAYERYHFAEMLRDDLNETLRRVAGHSSAVKQAALIYRIIELTHDVTLAKNPNAITGAMQRADEDGSTPRVVGWQWFTNTYGEIGTNVTGVFLQVYTKFIGPISYMTIQFLTVMIDMSLYALIALTPFLLLIGVAAPKRAAGFLVITVLPVFVLKFVPVTLIILNNIAGMIYDLLPGAMGADAAVAQAMLIMGMASMYSGLVGLTMFLLFKFGDAGTFMSGLTGLDKAAHEAAKTGATLMKTFAAMAAAVIVGGPAAVVGGMSWGKIKKNWGVKGNTTPPAPEGADGNGKGTDKDGGGSSSVSDPALRGAGVDTANTALDSWVGGNWSSRLNNDPLVDEESRQQMFAAANGGVESLQKLANEGGIHGTYGGGDARFVPQFDSNGDFTGFKAVAEQIGGPLSPTESGIASWTGGNWATRLNRDNLVDDDARQKMFEAANGDAESLQRLQAQGGITGTYANAPVKFEPQIDANGQLTGFKAVSLNAEAQTGAAPGKMPPPLPGAAAAPDAVPDTAAVAAGEPQTSTQTAARVAPAAGASAPAQAAATTGEPSQQTVNRAVPATTGGGAPATGAPAAAAAGETAQRPARAALDPSMEEQSINTILQERMTNAVRRKMDLEAEIAVKGNTEELAKKLEQANKDIAAVHEINAIQGDIGERIAAVSKYDADLKLNERRIGADKDFTSLADAGKLWLSGTFGGARSLMKGAGGIPILGDVIREVLNESMEGKERLKAWNAAGGAMKYWGAYNDAQRLAMYKKATAPIGAGYQYQQLDDQGAFQSMVTSAKFDAAVQAAKARSDLEAMIAKRVKDKDNPITIQQIDVQEMNSAFDYTARDFQGLGMKSAAEKLASTWGEAAAMQGNTWRVSVWDDKKKKYEDKDFKPTASGFQQIYGGLEGKKAGKYFDEAMVGWYGLVEKYGRPKKEWAGTGAMPDSKAALAQFIVEDVGTDYLVGGHNKMVDGKLQFYEAKGKYAEYVRLRNDEAAIIMEAQMKAIQTPEKIDALVNKVYDTSKKVDAKGRIDGMSKADVVAALKASPKDLKAMRALGNTLGGEIQKALVDGMGGDKVLPMAGLAEEAMQRGMNSVQIKSRTARYNMQTMNDNVADAVLKAQTSNLEATALNKMAQRNLKVKYGAKEMDLAKGSRRAFEFLMSNYGESMAIAFLDVMKDQSFQKDAIESVVKDIKKDGKTIGREGYHKFSERVMDALQAKTGKDIRKNEKMIDGSKFASARIVGEGYETEDLKTGEY